MYEISTETYALISENLSTTRIMEESQEILVNEAVNKIVSKSCRYFGSSFIGRVEGTKALINISYKAPIILEETNELIFFPTSSPRNDICHWLNLKAIKNYQKQNNKTLITFQNNDILLLPISYSSFDNQYLRASKLLLALKCRKEKIKLSI